MSTYVKTYKEFKAKVIEAVGEDYYDDDQIQNQYSYYTTSLYDADGVAKNNLAECFFDVLKEAKEEVEAEAKL